MPANQPFFGEVVDNGATYWDIIIIANIDFLGFVEVTGGVSRDIQINKPKGADGATITDNGYKLANLDITLSIVTQFDWDSFQNDLLPLIHPRRKGGPRTPVVFTHPAMNVLGITRIYFTQIGALKVGKDKIGTINLKAIEWAAAPKVVKKAAGKGHTAVDAGTPGVTGFDPSGAFGSVYGTQGPSEFALEGIGF